MNLRLREQTMLLVALAITFFVLTMVKTVSFPNRDPNSEGKYEAQNVNLQSRSILLLAVTVIVLVLDLVKVSKQMKRIFCCLSGVALVFAGLAVLFDFYDVQHKHGTIHHLRYKHENKTLRVANIVGTVGAGLALVVGATHLLQCVA